MANANPRDLDPKFKDAHVPTTESDDVSDAKDSGPEDDPEGGFIVHRQRVITSDGTAIDKVHGPMPVREWARYEKENGL